MADTEHVDQLSVADRLDLLAQEWVFINKSIEWNYNVFERHRTLLFAFASLLVGFEVLPFNLQGVETSGLPLGVWIAAPFVALIMLYRMLSQFHFVNLKNFRLSRIEATIERYAGSREHFRLVSMIKNDNKRLLSNPYALTQISILLFVFGVIIYALWRGYLGLTGMTYQGVELGLVFLGASLVFAAAFAVQFFMVVLEAGSAKVEEQLHR